MALNLGQPPPICRLGRAGQRVSHRPCFPRRQLRFAADQRAAAIANLAAVRGMCGMRGMCRQAGGAPADSPNGSESPDAPNNSYPKTEDGLFLRVPRLSP